MKQFWQEVGLAVILGMLMPGLILNIVTISSHRHAAQDNPERETVAVGERSTVIPVLCGDNIMEMELESYLTGVVLAEMPASFGMEALKAQAVVARTYTLRAYETAGKHDTAAVCTDSACCQAYCPADDYLRNGGTLEALDKVRGAVADTAGLVLTYQGKLIEATYFSCSGGSTEDAVAVWGTDVPYLQAVESPGEEQAAHYSDEVTFTVAELAERLNLAAANQLEIGDIVYTSGGGVAQIRICGILYEGTEIRNLLELPSTAFTVTQNTDTVTFHTRGFGHRVGMSQYGADAMAASGSTFEEILYHYYQGTTLETVPIDKADTMD